MNKTIIDKYYEEISEISKYNNLIQNGKYFDDLKYEIDMQSLKKIGKINQKIKNLENKVLERKFLGQDSSKISILKNTLQHKEELLNEAMNQISAFQEETKQLKESLKNFQEELKVLQDANIKRIEEENNDNKKKIDSMTKKYVKKQKRVQFEVPNVIYIVTTELLKKERRYILGKATDLTDRLSTYNKTDEHQVVYYQGCGDVDSMSLVENVVFHKLKEYREQANRERFVLPEGVSIDIFIEAIKKSVEACK